MKDSGHVVMKKSLARALLDHSIQHFDGGGQVPMGTGVQKGSPPVGGFVGDTFSQAGNFFNQFGPFGAQGPLAFAGINPMNTYQATAPQITTQDLTPQIQNQQANQANVFGQQQTLANKLSGLADQYGNQAAGQGPNPAQAMLNQATGQNVATQAALMAGQRGASANPALMARQIANQGAQTEQQAVGQAAGLQAQQQLAQQQQQLAAEQALAQQQATMGAQSLQGQSIAQGALAAQNTALTQGQLGAQNINANVAGQNAQTAGGILGGGLNAIGGGLSSLFNQGGKVQSFDGGGIAQYMAPAQMTSLVPYQSEGFQSSPFMPKKSGGDGGGSGGILKMASLAAMASDGGEIRPMLSGGPVPGKEVVAGNSPKNDIVPAVLSAGEEVIDKETLHDPGPVGQAARFVANSINSRNKGDQKYKVSEDKHHFIFKHAGGEIKALKSALSNESSAKYRSMLKDGQRFDEGGSVLDDPEAQPSQEQASIEESPVSLIKDMPSVADSVQSASSKPTPQQSSQPEVPTGPSAEGMPGLQDINALEKRMVGATNKEAEAKISQQQQQAEIFKPYLENEQKRFELFQNNLQGMHDAAIKLQNDIADKKIDPDRFWKDKTTGKKVGSFLSIVLSGIGQGMSHSNTNLAYQAIQNEIDRDIDAQKADLGKKQTLLGDNLRIQGNLMAAEQATRLQAMSILQGQLQQMAAKTGSPLIMAQAQKEAAQIGLQMLPMKQQLAVAQTQNQIRNMLQRGDVSNVDPSQLVQWVVPKEHQKAVFDEIERAQDTKRVGGDILAAFDRAAKEMHGGIEGPMNAATFGHYQSSGQQALHQSLQPTFKDLEGTVRQAAMDNTFKNITPTPYDSASRIASRRKELESYLRSKSSAPTAKGFGIDLDRFKSTAPMSSPQIKTVNGIKYMRGPNGEAIRMP